MNPGRVPLRASPYKVNCDTASTPPPTSSTERFIFPCSSSKMRRSQTSSAIHRASSSPSCVPTPSRTQRPCATEPVTFPSTVTDASDTRCTTARTGHQYQNPACPAFVLNPLVLGARGRRGLARVQRLQQRRHVVGVLLLLLEDLLHQPPRGGVVVS